jgi:hypothetical protein
MPNLKPFVRSLAVLAAVGVLGLARPAYAVPPAQGSCMMVTFAEDESVTIDACSSGGEDARGGVGAAVRDFVGSAWVRFRNTINPHYHEQFRDYVRNAGGGGGTRD